MRNWLVQLLVDVGLVRPRDEVEGATAAEPRPAAAPQSAAPLEKPNQHSDRRMP
ncbi:hypothetical protein J2S75_001693 [Ancylobacter polymorphus]|uniref:Uncharacterized protein n=1 Tax=Ancylobacter polymorphus TaxID=223390 RepID=A0ABU0BB99_9HYPH|nr:hypothetical protein [Ancylobacter polymorphus]